MAHLVARKFATSLVIVAGLAAAGPSRAPAAGLIHVIAVTDDQDKKVGESVQRSCSEFLFMFARNSPHDRYSIKEVRGAAIGPEAILEATRSLSVTAGEDTVVVYSATHGGYDPNQGSYLFFPRTRQSLTRSDLKAAIESKGARLSVLITESCNNVKAIPGVRHFWAPAPSFQMPVPADFSPIFHALFLSHVGFVDIASSKPGERSLCYPKLRSGRVTFVSRGAIFTEALLGAMSMRKDEALTWSQLIADVAPVVRSDFRQYAPDGLEDEDEPDKIQWTQTVDLRSPGAWSPTDEEQGHANTRVRLGATGQGIAGVGVKVVEVNGGSAAQKMGLEAGDVILAINGVKVEDNSEYVRLIKASGERIALDVRDVHTGNVVRLQGDLDDAQDDGAPPQPPSRPRFGAVAVPHNGGFGGLFVTHLVSGSAAARIQLEYGDIIVEINGRPINDEESYFAAVRESEKTMDLIIINVRNGQRQAFKVALDY